MDDQGKIVKCGIPEVFWLQVFFILFGVRSFCNLMKIYVMRYMPRSGIRYEILKLVTIDGCLLGWLVYGNMIYFSEKNDCRRYEAT